MAIDYKIKSLSQPYNDPLALATDIEPYFIGFVEQSQRKQLIKRMMQRIEQGLESDIKKRKILHFISKNAKKDQEEIDSELRLKIRDRFYKILYEKVCNSLPRFGRKRIIKTKKDQCLKFIKRNEGNIFDRIRVEIDDQK